MTDGRKTSEDNKESVRDEHLRSGDKTGFSGGSQTLSGENKVGVDSSQVRSDDNSKSIRTGQPVTNVHIITVIYNRRLEQIASLPEFEQLRERHSEVGLIIADNSTDEMILAHNREAASVNEKLRYIECGGNIGLSRAYNRALATIPLTEPFWVMLADDDTRFLMDYLENGYRQVQREERLSRRQKEEKGCDRKLRKPLQVLCGVVETKNSWISPRTEHTKEMVFSSLLKRPAPGIYQDLYPINSGIFLAGSAIQKAGGFDESLFMDQVDFLMMDRLRASGIRRIGVLPGRIRQSFSGEIGTGSADRCQNRQQEIAAKKARWEIFHRDFLTYCNLTGKSWCYRSYILGRRKLMLCAQMMISGRKR